MNTIETQTEKIDLENTVATIRTNTVDMNTIETQTDLPFTAECPVCMEDGFKLKDLNILICGHYTCRPCGLRVSTSRAIINRMDVRTIKCVICRNEDIIARVDPPTPPRIAPTLPQPVPQPVPPPVNQAIAPYTLNLDILDHFIPAHLEQRYKDDLQTYFSRNGLGIFLRDMDRYINIPDNNFQPQLRFECIKFRAIIKTFLLTHTTNRPKCVNGNCRSNRGTQRKCPRHSIEIPCCLNCRTCCFCQNIQPRDQLRRRLGSRPTTTELRLMGEVVDYTYTLTLMGPVWY